MAAYIALSGKDEYKYFTCDVADADFAESKRWYLDKYGYVTDNKRKYFHILTLGYADEGLEWDHIDGNRSNNCRDNLRMCTHGQNMMHVERKDNTSGVPGISFFKPTGKWRARIFVNKREVSLGYFDTFEAAVEARMAAVRVEINR